MVLHSRFQNVTQFFPRVGALPRLVLDHVVGCTDLDASACDMPAFRNQHAETFVESGEFQLNAGSSFAKPHRVQKTRSAHGQCFEAVQRVNVRHSVYVVHAQVFQLSEHEQGLQCAQCGRHERNGVHVGHAPGQQFDMFWAVVLGVGDVDARDVVEV